MIAVFNKKKNVLIQIDEKKDWIQFSPYDYMEDPYLKIEMKNFNYLKHSEKCTDCTQFLDSFGTESTDWRISSSNKVKIINMTELGGNSKNQIKSSISDYHTGSIIMLSIYDTDIDKESLQEALNYKVEKEDYKSACILRDLIHEI